MALQLRKAHTHACSVPGCTTRCECDATPVIDEIDREGNVSGHMSCQEMACDDWLCEQHALETPCDYCGSYGHDSDECAGEWVDRCEYQDQQADAAYAVAKESR